MRCPLIGTNTAYVFRLPVPRLCVSHTGCVYMKQIPGPPETLLTIVYFKHRQICSPAFCLLLVLLSTLSDVRFHLLHLIIFIPVNPSDAIRALPLQGGQSTTQNRKLRKAGTLLWHLVLSASFTIPLRLISKRPEGIVWLVGVYSFLKSPLWWSLPPVTFLTCLPLVGQLESALEWRDLYHTRLLPAELGDARFITAGHTGLVPDSAVKYCAVWHISPPSQMGLFQIEAPAASSWWMEGDGSKAHVSAWELSAVPGKRATEARRTHWTDDRNLSVGQQRDGWSHTGREGRIELPWPFWPFTIDTEQEETQVLSGSVRGGEFLAKGRMCVCCRMINGMQHLILFAWWIHC